MLKIKSFFLIITFLFFAGDALTQPVLMPGWPWNYLTSNELGLFIGPRDGLTFMNLPDGSGYVYPIGLTDSLIFMFDISGNVLPGWPLYVRGLAGKSKPPIYDADGDGLEEAFMVVDNWEPGWPHRMLHALNYLGQEAPGFPVEIPRLREYDYRCRPVLIDLDLDLIPEIVLARYQDSIPIIFTMNGEPYNNFHGQVDSFVEFYYAVGDLDRDGNDDLIASAAHKVYAFDRHGNDLPGWPIQMRTGGWGQYLTWPWGTPVLADIDNDGYLEVILSTYRYIGGSILFEGWLEVYRHDGSIQPGWPYHWENGLPITCPVVGDLDQDGELEIIVVGADENKPWLIPPGMWVFNADGTISDGWPIELENAFEPNPIIGDLDGDGFPDILIGVSSIHFGPGDSIRCHYWAYNKDGELLDGWPLELPAMSGWSSPCIGDFDKNGTANLLVSTSGQPVPSPPGNRIFGSFLYMYELGFPFDSSATPWGQAGHDRWNTSNYEFVEPVRVGITENPSPPLPSAACIKGNYPNPFNASTTIEYEIAFGSEVELSIYDILGRKVTTLIDGRVESGWHSVKWEASGLSSGIYFARLTARQEPGLSTGDDSVTKKMVLVK
jgi:hypothetical protein